MSCGHMPGLPCPCDAPLLTPPVNVQFGFLPQLAAAIQVAASAVAVGKEVGIGKKKHKAEPVPVYVPPPSVFDAFGPQNRTLVMLGMGGLGLAVILKLTQR